MHSDFRESNKDNNYLVSTALLVLSENICRDIYEELLKEYTIRELILEHCVDPEEFREGLAARYHAKQSIDIFIATSTEKIVSQDFAKFPPGKLFEFKAEEDDLLNVNSIIDDPLFEYSEEKEMIAVCKEPIYEVTYE